jgi:hypothetical protein
MTSGARNTRDFLNLLRVVGRMWGSHGDKITATSQGRDVDSEKADKLRRAAAGGDFGISSRCVRRFHIGPKSSGCCAIFLRVHVSSTKHIIYANFSSVSR